MTIPPGASAPPYEKPPIIEAVIAIHFAVPLEQKSIDVFTLKRRAGFPRSEDMVEVNTSFDTQAERTASSMKKIGRRLYSADGARVIIILPTQFSVQRGRPQPSHGIAEMVDVNDFAEIVRPICPTILVILARPAGWRLAAREHGCDRCEEVAPVKARREALWLPVDVPAACLSGTALDQLEQALPGPTYHRPSASRITAGRAPPTPGSTTQRKTVPA